MNEKKIPHSMKERGMNHAKLGGWREAMRGGRQVAMQSGMPPSLADG
jgi:hypothetical protein